jgi:hypothetical protein
MGIWAGIKWVGREGAGVGATKRFGGLIIRSTSNLSSSFRDRPGKVWGIQKQFLDSAASVVMTYGPSWAGQSILGRALGVWLLVILWILPPSIVVASAVCKPHQRSKAQANRSQRSLDAGFPGPEGACLHEPILPDLKGPLAIQ